MRVILTGLGTHDLCAIETSGTMFVYTNSPHNDSSGSLTKTGVSVLIVRCFTFKIECVLLAVMKHSLMHCLNLWAKYFQPLMKLLTGAN